MAWHPIESAPKDGRLVVLLGRIDSNKPEPIRACIATWEEEARSPFFVQGWAYVSPGYVAAFKPTHWAELPPYDEWKAGA